MPPRAARSFRASKDSEPSQAVSDTHRTLFFFIASDSTSAHFERPDRKFGTDVDSAGSLRP